MFLRIQLKYVRSNSYLVGLCAYAPSLPLQILVQIRPKLSFLSDIELWYNNCRYFFHLFFHFWHFFIHSIYEPINDIYQTIKVNRLLIYIHRHMMRLFHITVISILPIMQQFKYSVYHIFALLFNFKGPKHQNYARDPMLKLLF